MKILSTERTVVLAPVRLVAMLSGGNLQIRSAQKLAWENKVAKVLNTTDVPLRVSASGLVLPVPPRCRNLDV